MSWCDVLKLVRMAGGDESLIPDGRMQVATSTGRGDPDSQLRIARIMFRVNHHQQRKRRKEAGHGQTRWEFG
jgi:hypothetical protein